MITSEELLQLAADWRALQPDNLKPETVEQIAKAYEMQAEDGIPRCTCHLLPYNECPTAYRRDR